MENNEKLLEAAKMLKKHCEQVESCKKCCFSIIKDKTVVSCIISTADGTPCGWKISGSARWTPVDKAVATGLKANGYNSVTRACDDENVIAIGREKTKLELGKDLFESLACNEVVNLDEIIGEDEDGKDF